MDRTEGVALVLVLLVMIGLPLAAYNYETWRMATSPEAVIDVQAWADENGGWSPKRIVVEEGDVVRLSVQSMDITHSFVVPELGLDSGAVKPGRHVEVDIGRPAPGVYRFYCGVWCSRNHGAMVGTLVVVGAGE